MSKIFIPTVNVDIVTRGFSTSEQFAGTTDHNIYIDPCLRLFWNGSAATPWFKIEALVTGKFSFGSLLIKSAANQEYHATVDPTVASTEYFLNDNTSVVPSVVFNQDQFNTFNASMRYKPDTGEACNYIIKAQSSSGFAASTSDALVIVVRSFIGDNITA